MIQTRSLFIHLRLATTAGVLLIGLLPCVASSQSSLEPWGWAGQPGAHNLENKTPGGSAFASCAVGWLHSIALRADGSLVAWGENDDFGVLSSVPNGTGFTQVAAGDRHFLALSADGSIVAWGNDGENQVTNAPAGPGYVQIAAYFGHCVALHSDGSIVAWGWDHYSQVTSAPSGVGFTDIDVGYRHSMALRADGTIVSWGYDGAGVVTYTPAGPGFTAIVAGYAHSLALRSNGSIEAWGSDFFGEVSNLPGGTGFLGLGAGWESSFALRPDGSIVAWGQDVESIVSNSPPGSGFSRLFVSRRHALALRSDHPGNAYCFGDGTGTTCPCTGHGNLGEGCANRGGDGATLLGLGVASLSADSFRLEVKGVLGMRPGLLLRGSHQTNGGMGNSAGDGLLCTVGQSLRSQVQVTSAFGFTAFTDFQGSPFGFSSIGVGIPTNYQFWYRDPSNTCTGAGFNFSNAWTVNWRP